MLRLPLLLLFALIIVSCDDALDLRLPEGQLPDAPIAVIFHPEDAEYLELRWTRIPRAEGYHVYSSIESDGQFELIASPRDTVWRHELSQAFAGDSYYPTMARFYAVTAVVDDAESVHSGQVGVIRLNINGSGTPGVISTLPFGLPLTAWLRDNDGVPILRTTSSAASDVVDCELRRRAAGFADQIRYPNDTTSAVWRDEAGTWHGAFAQNGFPSGTACQWINYSGSAIRVYLCGFVQNGSLDSVWITGATEDGHLSSTYYAWRESRSQAVDRLGLLEVGFIGGTATSSDKVVQTIGGGFTYFDTDRQSWRGGLTKVVPGQCYQLVIKHAGGFSYTYVAPE